MDDEREVHRLTSIVLDEFVFEGKGLTCLSAYSGEEAKDLIRDHPDTALILLDVVMETDHAGLDVVRYVRETLGNHIVQIVLRTGQAGQAPQQEVIAEYEINDYNSKVELTAARMITTVTSSLRAYRLSRSLVALNDKLHEELLERERTRTEIHRLTQFQESVIENAHIWLHVINDDRKTVIWNKAAECISGYSKAEVLADDRIWARLFESRSGQVLSEPIRQFIAHNSELFDEEIPIACKKGETKNIVWNSWKLFDPAGKTMGMMVLGRDVTEQKKLERQFRQAEKMEAVGRMAGSLAHDFNNLLTVIRGYCELSMLRLNEHDRLYNKINHIDRAAERAEKLIRRLLLFSRNHTVAPKAMSLNLLINDMAEMIRRLVSEDVALRIRLNDSVGHIHADPGQLEQVIINLVLNARDAMQTDGELRIETDCVPLKDTFFSEQAGVEDGWYVTLAISDTGHGMDDDVMEHIFEPFYTTKEKGKGTGLGLSTVYGIVTQSGGQIRAQSDVGRGTRFELYFPMIDACQ